MLKLLVHRFSSISKEEKSKETVKEMKNQNNSVTGKL